MTSDKPQGKRFSHVYMRVDTTLPDSKKARFRVARICLRLWGGKASEDTIILAIQEEVGIPFVFATYGYKDWGAFFDKISTTELLDTITVIGSTLIREGLQIYLKDFQSTVKRVFEEERLAYEIDALCGIHPLIDDAYQATRRSAVAGLSGDRYSATMAHVEDIDTWLLVNPPNYIQAIRSTFSANENLFKLMYAGTIRLDAKAAKENLSKHLQRRHTDRPIAQRASAQVLSSFVGWVDAAHHYRHEDGAEEPNQPSEELAVVLISEGLAFVRWLAALDKNNPG